MSKISTSLWLLRGGRLARPAGEVRTGHKRALTFRQAATQGARRGTVPRAVCSACLATTAKGPATNSQTSYILCISHKKDASAALFALVTKSRDYGSVRRTKPPRPQTLWARQPQGRRPGLQKTTIIRQHRPPLDHGAAAALSAAPPLGGMASHVRGGIPESIQLLSLHGPPNCRQHWKPQFRDPQY